MLTQVQRDAMSRAQAGDFRLADAIELLHPERRSFRGEMLIGGIAQGGRLQLLVYGDEGACACCDDGTVDCEFCEGGQQTCDACKHANKCVECNGAGVISCSQCDGTGITAHGLDAQGWCYVANLNGDVIYASGEDNSDTPPLEITLTEVAARKVVAAYEAEGTETAPGAAQPSLGIEGALAA